MNNVLQLTIFFVITCLLTYIFTNLILIYRTITMRNTYRKICDHQMFSIYDDYDMYKFIFDNGLIIKHYYQENKIIINDEKLNNVNMKFLFPFHYYYTQKICEFTIQAEHSYSQIIPLTPEQRDSGYIQKFDYDGTRIYSYMGYSQPIIRNTYNFKFLK